MALGLFSSNVLLIQKMVNYRVTELCFVNDNDVESVLRGRKHSSRLLPSCKLSLPIACNLWPFHLFLISCLLCIPIRQLHNFTDDRYCFHFFVTIIYAKSAINRDRWVC